MGADIKNENGPPGKAIAKSRSRAILESLPTLTLHMGASTSHHRFSEQAT